MIKLRSRVVSSAVPPKTAKPLARENAMVEPATPSKTFELMNQSTSKNTTPSSNFPDPDLCLGFKDTAVPGTGTLRRRSARLVGKSENSENAQVAERKKDDGHFRNLEKMALDLDNKDSGNESVTELVMEGVTASGSGRRKRKLSMERKSSHKEDEQEKRFMCMRSGKRAMKIKMTDGDDDDSFEGIENSKESDLVSSDDDDVVEDEKNILEKGMGVGREEKGKGKVVNETLMVKSEKDDSEEVVIETGVMTRGKMKLRANASSSEGINISEVGIDYIHEICDDDVVEDEKNGLGKEIGVGRDEKGKGKVVNETLIKSEKDDSEEVVIETGVMTRAKMKLRANASSSEGINISEVGIDYIHENFVSGANDLATNEELPVEELPAEAPQPQPHQEAPQPQPQQEHVNHLAANNNNIRNAHIQRHRNFARRNAARFAIFTSEQEIGNDYSAAPDRGVKDLPGEFSAAVKKKKDYGANETWPQYGASKNVLEWVPKKQDLSRCNKHIPSLQELCLSILCKNADSISSLESIPDSLRHKISWFLCDGRGMNSKFLELLLRDSPTEVRIRDCSWLTEELVTKKFDGVDASKLMVLQFDLGGGCMPDYILRATLFHSPNCLPALTTLSLKGAYRLTDAGLHMLASAAPSLKSIDISLCPLLTSDGICSLLNSMRLILRELYLDNSDGVDAMLILPALLDLERLEVLSLAGIQTVSDDFVSKFVSANGCRMKEFVLADCLELTDLSLEVIGGNCPELRAVDLSNLRKLTDVSMGHLANGCPKIEILKVCRSAFSDEAISAYLDLRGESLKDLSLNNITRVSNNTALSLARNCRNLRRLDLSWCRNLTNEALGLIVDSCSLLEVLKLFGCTQVTNVFLDGHSNPLVKILGFKMTSIIKYIEVPDFLQGPLRYSAIYP